MRNKKKVVQKKNEKNNDNKYIWTDLKYIIVLSIKKF